MFVVNSIYLPHVGKGACNYYDGTVSFLVIVIYTSEEWLRKFVNRHEKTRCDVSTRSSASSSTSS